MKDNMEIWTLLYIVHKTVHLPKLKAIHDWAEAQLVDIARDLGKVPSDQELVAKSSAPVNDQPSVGPTSRPSAEFDASAPAPGLVDGEVERKV